MLAIVVGMAAGTAAMIVGALRHPLAWPSDAIYHDASTYVVLLTMLLIGLIAAAIDLARLIRRMRHAARLHDVTSGNNGSGSDRYSACGDVSSTSRAIR
ncbi:hypothetical protein [Burkholderia sp. IMCC1007]|uniref:hypothetical protein n=1 Tax=Burkholderia sp. IMCC1007 TaxID=3004104 RepID=UPI0022B4FEA7|nr:hypothetical protein [Burkholderia sp. IMCC1007]